MGKAKVTIVMEIAFDELQYETDGILSENDLLASFRDEFSCLERQGGYDMTYEVKNLDLKVEDFKSEVDINSNGIRSQTIQV